MSTTNIILIPLLPLLSFILLGLGGKRLFGDKAGWIASLAMLISFVLACGVCYGQKEMVREGLVD
jgi:NADH:ubiquinone oxidoreductase subunit 5 (subunit L)/multisubunit Na+/H+ antiporter MnhA subunit